MERKQEMVARLPISDEKIIELYWKRDESAISETDLKYKYYLLSIANNIVHNQSDCEECVNDTYLGVWNAIPPTKPNVFKAFISVIIRRIAINRYNSNNRKGIVPSEMTVALSELDDMVSGTEDVEEKIDYDFLGKLISSYLRSLNERRLYIFMSRYYFAEAIEKIARDLNLSKSMVNKELATIRKELKDYLESEGYCL